MIELFITLLVLAIAVAIIIGAFWLVFKLLALIWNGFQESAWIIRKRGVHRARSRFEKRFSNLAENATPQESTY